MKAFQFRLERVLHFREGQLRVEEARLEQMRAGRRQFEGAIEGIDESVRRASGARPVGQFVYAADLTALDLFKKRAGRERVEALGRLQAHDGIIAKQQEQVVQARRKVRLLERLREKRKGEWQIESDKELEELTADFTASQWLLTSSRTPAGE